MVFTSMGWRWFRIVVWKANCNFAIWKLEGLEFCKLQFQDSGLEGNLQLQLHDSGLQLQDSCKPQDSWFGRQLAICKFPTILRFAISRQWFGRQLTI